MKTTNKAKSRTQNSTRNIAFSAIAYSIQIVLGFLVRRYFIYYFNEEFLGLNSLFSNVLSVLSLAEMGIGGAIVFAMYKPVAEGDSYKVNALLRFYRKCYFIIGVIVAVLGLLVLPFMDYFKAKAPQVDVNLYIVYLIYLFNSVVSYFFAYRRALLYTDQRQDIESKINIITSLLQYIIQLLVIILVKNFYLYSIIAGIASLVGNIFIYIVTNKKYGEIIHLSKSTLDKETKNSIKKNVYAMLFHKIGGVVVFGTDSLLIYLLIGASDLGRYSNYVLITTAVGYIFSIYINALKGSIGNSIATRNKEENLKLFNKINMLHFFMCAFCTICIFVLANPFIDTILVKGDTTLALDMPILIIICINFYLSKARDLMNCFKECAGLFYPDRYKPIVESIVNLVSSIVFAKLWGIAGILLGTILSTIVMPLWVEPYVVNKYYFKKPLKNYFFKFAYYTICMVISCIITYFICGLLPTSGFLWLVIKFIVCGFCSILTLLCGFYWMPEFKECVAWGKEIWNGFVNKRKIKKFADGDVVIDGELNESNSEGSGLENGTDSEKNLSENDLSDVTDLVDKK